MNPGADEVGEQFDMPLADDEEAATRAWQNALAFYRELFDR